MRLRHQAQTTERAIPEWTSRTTAAAVSATVATETTNVFRMPPITATADRTTWTLTRRFFWELNTRLLPFYLILGGVTGLYWWSNRDLQPGTRALTDIAAIVAGVCLANVLPTAYWLWRNRPASKAHTSSRAIQRTPIVGLIGIPLFFAALALAVRYSPSAPANDFTLLTLYRIFAGMTLVTGGASLFEIVRNRRRK
jgi:hypothetical protein